VSASYLCAKGGLFCDSAALYIKIICPSISIKASHRVVTVVLTSSTSQEISIHNLLLQLSTIKVDLRTKTMTTPTTHPHHPTGHCRAQRGALEYHNTSRSTIVIPETVLSEAQEYDWAACYDEVERWHTPEPETKSSEGQGELNQTVE
jgi:hypothetical protein